MKPIVALLGSVVLATTLHAQTIQVNKENRTIAITTNGEASALADVAVVEIGYTVYAKDKDTAYAEASAISNGVINALHKATVADNQITGNGQSLSPIQDEDNRFAQGIRFKLHQEWEVTVDASQAANVFHIAVQAGANDAGNVHWRVRDQRGLEAQAAKEALSHAKEIAQQMADGLNAKLGTLMYASNQAPPRGLAALLAGQGMVLNTASASLAARVGPLVIKPQRVQESATVYAVFAIQE